jgi:hypothetical protein
VTREQHHLLSEVPQITERGRGVQMQPQRNRRAVRGALQLLGARRADEHVAVRERHHQPALWHEDALHFAALTNRNAMRVPVEELQVRIARDVKERELELEVGEFLREASNSTSLVVSQRLERMEDETNALALLPVALLANALERGTQRCEHLVRVVVEGDRLGDGVEEVRSIPAENGRKADKSRALGQSTRPNARAGDADDELVRRRRVGTQKP